MVLRRRLLAPSFILTFPNSHEVVTFLLTASFLYLICAVVLSANFRLVWSLALFLLLSLTYVFFNQPFSAYTPVLVVSILVDFAICVALSPAHVFFHNEPINPSRNPLEVLYPNREDSGEAIFAEFVLSFPELNVNMTDLTLSPLQASLPFMVSHRTRERHGNRAKNHKMAQWQLLCGFATFYRRKT